MDHSDLKIIKQPKLPPAVQNPFGLLHLFLVLLPNGLDILPCLKSQIPLPELHPLLYSLPKVDLLFPAFPQCLQRSKSPGLQFFRALHSLQHPRKLSAVPVLQLQHQEADLHQQLLSDLPVERSLQLRFLLGIRLGVLRVQFPADFEGFIRTDFGYAAGLGCLVQRPQAGQFGLVFVDAGEQ